MAESPRPIKSIHTSSRKTAANRKQDFSALQFDKLQPQARDLEEVVLGGMMLNKDAVAEVIDILKAESFYVDAHQRIFEAIHQLFSKSEPVDILTVVEQLRKDGTLDEVGGPFYVTQLTNRVGSTANIEYHARIISEKYILRELIKTSNVVIKDAYEETTDVFELLDKAEQNLFSITEQNLRRSYDNMTNLVAQAIKNIEAIKDNEEGLVGIPSGFTALDRITSGWQKSDLVIMAARPGMGKTAFVLSVARNAAVDFGRPIAVFSLEMSNLQLVNRLISAETGIPGDKLKRGDLQRHEWVELTTKVEKLSEAPLFIDDTPALNIFELRAKCRRLKMQHDIQMIIIDYLQLMSGTSDSKGNREQEISTISRSLKSIAKELNVPVIALSQLSRAVETRGGDKRPQLSDLRECVTGDTLIYLPDTGTYERVDELIKREKFGFNILALNPEYRLEKAMCLDIWETGEKEIYEVETTSGFTIKTSLNHPFYTIDGWKKLEELQEGDFVGLARSLAASSKEQSFQTTINTNHCGSPLSQSNISHNKLEQVAEVVSSKQLKDIAHSDIKWEKIKRITHIGKAPTYDLYIDGLHNFVANNFIIHNSGAIEQDADMVIFLYRPEYYGFDHDDDGNPVKGLAEVIIAKHRNGALDTVNLRFVAQNAKFENMDLLDTSFEGLTPLNEIITVGSKMNENEKGGNPNLPPNNHPINGNSGNINNGDDVPF